jgi:hypothetical protein
LIFILSLAAGTKRGRVGCHKEATMKNKPTVRQVRLRLNAIAKDLRTLQQSAESIAKAIERLRLDVDVDWDAMREACEAIDFDEFMSGLGPRANKLLRRMGFVDGKSLAGLTRLDLECCTNLGPTTQNEIMDRLASYGIEIPEGE